MFDPLFGMPVAFEWNRRYQGWEHLIKLPAKKIVLL